MVLQEKVMIYDKENVIKFGFITKKVGIHNGF